MRTLVFSDTHLTRKFNEKQYNALVELISKADQVIIDGDFWEGMGISFDDFLNSEWQKLFPLLKEKHTIYVYGNHDPKSLSDERVFRFCEQAVCEYELNTPTRSYLFKHGHQFLFPQHTNECLERDCKESQTPFRRFRLTVADALQNIIFGLFGPKILPKSINHISSQQRLTAGNPYGLLVCGHTHRPYYDDINNFIDIGFFSHGWANYLTIDDQGDFELISKRY